MMAEYLDKDGLEFLIRQIRAMIEQATRINVIAEISEDSTNQQIPGAKAVHDFLTAALEGIVRLRKEVVKMLPATGETNIIYLVKADEDTYTQYMYIDGNWFDLGTTDVDLSGYWAKEDLVAMTNAEIQAIIDDTAQA
jgi:hypothetical protein